MSEFKEGVMISTNVLMWLLIVNYVAVSYFDQFNSVNERAKDIFAVFAGIAVLFHFTKVIFYLFFEAVKEFLKCYDVTISPRKR